MQEWIPQSFCKAIQCLNETYKIQTILDLPISNPPMIFSDAVTIPGSAGVFDYHYKGSHFFKIDNDQLVEVAFVEGKYVGREAVHRDYHDYNGYLYAVCDENYSSLQIMDLHYLPDSVPVLYDSDSLIIRAHNLFIDTSFVIEKKIPKFV